MNKYTCEKCLGTGIEPAGWTLDDARKDPIRFDKDRKIRKYGPNSGIMNLMPHVVSPILFTDSGKEKCIKCSGTGKTAEHGRLVNKAKAKVRGILMDREMNKAKKAYPNLEAKKDSKLSDWALGAKNIRAELKAAFPGHKFSVKSESYAGGDSIDVYWTDGPTREEVEKIAGKYSEGYFDGMEDLYHYVDNGHAAVFGGAKYVMCNRSISEETEAKVKAEIGPIGGMNEWDYERHVRNEAHKRSYYEAPAPKMAGRKFVKDHKKMTAAMAWEAATAGEMSPEEAAEIIASRADKAKPWTDSRPTAPYEPDGSVVTTPKGDNGNGKKAEVGEYKGHPVITLPNGGRGFTFGMAKAKAILEHLDEIKKFVEGVS